MAVGLAYAVLRYHEAFFGTDPTDQVPLFLLNKAVSVAAVLMIALAVGARVLGRAPGRFGARLLQDRRRIGLTGFGLAVAHSAMSLVLLTPDYYGKLYLMSGRMNLAGEVSTLVGLGALALLAWQSRLPAAGNDDDRRLLRRLGLSVLVLSAAHVAVIGWGGWFAVGRWPGGLPPITLIAFVIAAAGLVMGLIPTRPRG